MTEKKTSEEDVRGAIALLQQYQSRAEAHQQQLALIELSIRECESALNTIDELGKVKADNTALVPIGAGAYLHATIPQVGRVLISLGAGVSAEKDSDAAKETLAKRREEFGKMHEHLNEELRRMYNDMQKIQLKIAQHR
ncbi:MAG: prefoldin subunit alpha [Methanosarcinales archaeon]|nr:MAG: prefoldin subunit alpha [Methanosarcinales archaeon]